MTCGKVSCLRVECSSGCTSAAASGQPRWRVPQTQAPRDHRSACSTRQQLSGQSHAHPGAARPTHTQGLPGRAHTQGLPGRALRAAGALGPKRGAREVGWGVHVVSALLHCSPGGLLLVTAEGLQLPGIMLGKGSREGPAARVRQGLGTRCADGPHEARAPAPPTWAPGSHSAACASGWAGQDSGRTSSRIESPSSEDRGESFQGQKARGVPGWGAWVSPA